MARWLVKEEPSNYSYEALVRDGRTEWNGVHNALALRHLRAMRPGDEAFFYHTGDVRAAIAVIRVAGEPHPDAADDRGSWAVAMEPVRPLRRAVSLAELRGDPALAGFVLIRMGRLSVMPVTDDQWSVILAHERSPTPAAVPRPATKARIAPKRTPAARRKASGVRRTPKRPSASAAGRRASGKGPVRGTGA